MDDKDLKKEVADFWSDNSVDYDSQPFHGLMSDDEKSAWMKFLSDTIGDDEKDVLEVGGGTGFISLMLAALGKRVKCTDISEGMLEKGIKKADENGLEDRVTFAIADAEDTGEPDNKYDVVINRQMIWMLPDPQKALDDWFRVLKPKGRVIIIGGDGSKTSDSDDGADGEENKSESKGAHHMHVHHMCDHDDKESDRCPWFSDEVLDSLPMIKGDRTPEEILMRSDAELKVFKLESIRRAEAAALKQKTGEESRHAARKVYILSKV